MTLWGTESVSQTGGQPIDPRLQYLGPANASGYVIQQIAPDGAMLNYPRRVGAVTAATPVAHYQLEAQGNADAEGHRLLRTSFPRTLRNPNGQSYVASRMDDFLVGLNLGYADLEPNLP